MKIVHHLIIRSILAITLAGLTASARAQLVADGQTNVLDGVTNIVNGTVTVGTNGSSTLLMLTNGALLTNSLDGVIGSSGVAKSNAVVLSGSNSTWLVGGDIFVGSNGYANRLVISNGSTVSGDFGHIGFNAFTANNNQVTVTGTNSKWICASNFEVGYQGAFNSLLITNGAMVTNGGGFNSFASIGYLSRAAFNQTTVTGTNSAWNINGSFYVGFSEASNRLLIANGGRVTASYDMVIGNTGGVGNDNEVIVSGANARMNTKTTLFVGKDGYRNTLLITNGGQLVNGSAYIGYGGSQNKATVIGTNSVWITTNGLFVGGTHGSSPAQNTLLIADRGRVQSGFGFIGSLPGNSFNQVTVTDPGTLWTNGGLLRIGGISSSCTLLIMNSGTVQASNVSVGGSYFDAATNLIYSSNNILKVANATLIVSNTSGTALLEVLSGSLVLNGGAITAGRVVLTNGASSVMQFSSGTLRTRGLTNITSSPFALGDGTNAASLILEGTNGHTFADGLLIQTNATLSGTGTINGSVTNCGTIFLTNADQMSFTGPVVNKGVIIAVTGTPRFGSTFTNFGTLITTASINVANVSVSGPDIVLQFNSVSNYLHEVQASTNVSSGVWQSLTNGLLGTGSPITFTDPGGTLSPNRTYRVLLH